MTTPKNNKGVAPLISSIPMYDFDSAEHMRKEMVHGEFIIGRIPNTNPKGFEYHVALVSKDKEGNMHSVAMMQHNGILKDTPENHDLLHPQEDSNAESQDKDSQESHDETPGSENQTVQE